MSKRKAPDLTLEDRNKMIAFLKDGKKKKKEPVAYEVEAEIFGIGMWNGMDFGVNDLMQIANAFHSLSEFHSVPLKFGHNEDQPFTDGQPALGWVTDVFVSEDKLKARFSDVPKIVADAINNGLYKKVSIELDMGVEHMGQQFPLVLSGVALLGADIPAVNTLEDLSVLMSKKQTLSRGSSRKTFTAVSNQEDITVTPEEIAAMQAKIKALEAQGNDHAAEQVKFAAEKATFKAESEAREAQALKDADVKMKKDFEARLEVLVKDNRMKPAQREAFMKEFDDKDIAGSVTKLNFAVAQIEDIKVNVHQKEQGMSDDEARKKAEEEGNKLPGEVLLSRVSEMRQKTPSLDFQTAKRMVFQADKDLARKYITENDGRAA